MTTWPVGDEQERRAAVDRLPGLWYDANPFLRPYYIAGSTKLSYHTGADLNLPSNADFHAPLYAIEDGTVIFAGNLGGSWGNVIVVKHSGFYCRYGHVENLQVRKGDPVYEGTVLCHVGDGNNYYPDSIAHLHWDIVITDILESSPGHWPGTDKVSLLKHYVAPIPFIVNRIKSSTIPMTETSDMSTSKFEVTEDSVRFRYHYDLKTPKIGSLSKGTVVDGYDFIRNGFRMCDYGGKTGYISVAYLTPH